MFAEITGFSNYKTLKLVLNSDTSEADQSLLTTTAYTSNAQQAHLNNQYFVVNNRQDSCKFFILLRPKICIKNHVDKWCWRSYCQSSVCNVQKFKVVWESLFIANHFVRSPTSTWLCISNLSLQIPLLHWHSSYVHITLLILLLSPFNGLCPALPKWA